MSAIVVFNSGASPQNVLQFIPSNSDPAAYAGRQDVLIDPNLLPVAGLSLIYWKVVSGALAAMTAPEQAAVDAANAAASLATERAGGIADLATQDATGAILRALGAVLVDEVNLVRDWLTNFQAAVAASTSLANLQTRVAGLPAMPDRTLAQLRTAIQAKINSGVVDS